MRLKNEVGRYVAIDTERKLEWRQRMAIKESNTRSWCIRTAYEPIAIHKTINIDSERGKSNLYYVVLLVCFQVHLIYHLHVKYWTRVITPWWLFALAPSASTRAVICIISRAVCWFIRKHFIFVKCITRVTHIWSPMYPHRQHCHHPRSLPCH